MTYFTKQNAKLNTLNIRYVYVVMHYYPLFITYIRLLVTLCTLNMKLKFPFRSPLFAIKRKLFSEHSFDLLIKLVFYIVGRYIEY